MNMAILNMDSKLLKHYISHFKQQQHHEKINVYPVRHNNVNRYTENGNCFFYHS